MGNLPVLISVSGDLQVGTASLA